MLSTSLNAGVSLQALMALLGHVSADMSLRYGKLFDATVRTEYERALDLAKQRLGAMPAGRAGLPLADVTGGAGWKDAPALKSRLAGGGEFGACLLGPDGAVWAGHRACVPLMRPSRRAMSLRCLSASLIQPRSSASRASCSASAFWAARTGR